MTTTATTPNPAVATALEGLKAAYGFVPQLLADLAAHSPAAFLGYLALAQAIEKNSTLTKQEQNAITLYVSALNKCSYCVGAHTKISQGVGVPADDIAHLAQAKSPNDPHLKLLAHFVYHTWQNHGHLTQADRDSYVAQGLTAQKQLDIVALITLKTLSNYGHAITHSQLDAAFKS